MANTVQILKKSIVGVEKVVEAVVTLSAYVASRSVADGVTTDTSTTVTSATAAFVAGDVGRILSGTGIPVGAYITQINSATSVEISAAATATATGVTITLSGGDAVPLSTLGLRRLISMGTLAQGGLGDSFVAQWDGAKVQPHIALYGDAAGASGLSEAPTAANTTVIQVVARGL